MGEYGAQIDQLSEPFVLGRYRCMISGDDILLADVHRASAPVGITSRSIQEYDQAGFPAKDIVRGRYGRNIRVLEIGTALSQFMPLWASIASVRPVVCDPVDYSLLRRLLNEVPYHFTLTKRASDEVKHLTDRAKILASGRVHHIPLPIDQAFARGALGRDFDVVVNMFTTSMYSSSDVSDSDLRSLLVSSPRKGLENITGLYYA